MCATRSAPLSIPNFELTIVLGPKIIRYVEFKILCTVCEHGHYGLLPVLLLPQQLPLSLLLHVLGPVILLLLLPLLVALHCDSYSCCSCFHCYSYSHSYCYCFSHSSCYCCSVIDNDCSFAFFVMRRSELTGRGSCGVAHQRGARRLLAVATSSQLRVSVYDPLSRCYSPDRNNSPPCMTARTNRYL